jgi:cyanuric acid amidohydrolase
MRVDVHRISMSNPADVSGLRTLIDKGAIDPTKIVASIGKTEGNGGANDFTRALATVSFASLLGTVLNEAPDDVARRIAFVWSGGCEGVLSPHATFITRDDSPSPAEGPGPRLAVAVQRTRDSAVGRALDELGTDASDVHYVQVKGPLLTPAGIADAAARGAAVVTTDPNKSKAYAR